MKKALVLVALCSLLVPSVGLAKPDKKLALATEVVKMVTPKSTYEMSIEQLYASILPSLAAQTGGNPSPQMQAKLKAAVKEALPYAELIEWSADIYAKHFNMAELKDLKRFYGTKTGKKMVQAMPELMAEVGTKMGQILPQRLPALLRKHGL